jgi:hypothetical protein
MFTHQIKESLQHIRMQAFLPANLHRDDPVPVATIRRLNQSMGTGAS